MPSRPPGECRELVHEVVRVLGEESGADHYEITLAELADILTAKVQPAARDAGVRFAVELSAEGKLANRHANLVLLILENLLHNAFQVTPRGQRVQLSIAAHGEEVRFEVADAGPGFPPHLLKNLFAVCRSTKGGSGLGLAISRQLAEPPRGATRTQEQHRCGLRLRADFAARLACRRRGRTRGGGRTGRGWFRSTSNRPDGEQGRGLPRELRRTSHLNWELN